MVKRIKRDSNLYIIPFSIPYKCTILFFNRIASLYVGGDTIYLSVLYRVGGRALCHRDTWKCEASRYQCLQRLYQDPSSALCSCHVKTSPRRLCSPICIYIRVRQISICQDVFGRKKYFIVKSSTVIILKFVIIKMNK